MYSIYLDEDNIEMYMEYIGEDVAENIGRTFFRGMIIADGETPLAGIVWENRNMTQDAYNEAHIIWLRIEDDEAGDMLFSEYNESISEDEIVKSEYSLPAMSTSREKEALRKAGFTALFTEGDLIKARLSEIAALKPFQKVHPSENIHALKTMTQRGFTAAVRSFVLKGKYGICEDLHYLPRSYFENDISCYSEANGEVNGIFLFHKKPSGGLEVVVMAAIGNDYGKILPEMIRFSVSNTMELYSDETEVLIDRHNYATLALSEKLFPRGFGIPVYVGSRQEK